MFLAICNETFGLTPEQTLDSDFVLLTSILREHNYIINQRNKQINGNEEEDENDNYIETVDFNTGEKKRIKKVKFI